MTEFNRDAFLTEFNGRVLNVSEMKVLGMRGDTPVTMLLREAELQSAIPGSHALDPFLYGLSNGICAIRIPGANPNTVDTLICAPSEKDWGKDGMIRHLQDCGFSRSEISVPFSSGELPVDRIQAAHVLSMQQTGSIKAEDVRDRLNHPLIVGNTPNNQPVYGVTSRQAAFNA